MIRVRQRHVSHLDLCGLVLIDGVVLLRLLRYGHEEGAEAAVRPGALVRPIHGADGVLEVSVRDNGIGCKSVTPGFGLQHMQERMLMLGGTFWYENSDGFCIRAEIPLRKTPGSEKRKQEETV